MPAPLGQSAPLHRANELLHGRFSELGITFLKVLPTNLFLDIELRALAICGREQFQGSVPSRYGPPLCGKVEQDI
jgi:hypothetical protein